MKLNNLTKLIMLALSFLSQAAQQNDSFLTYPDIILSAGGPDAYGYTWSDSDEVEGPVFAWIDITAVGAEVLGLADDNSVPLIPMNMEFHYYWATFNEIKIGSNGWLSFDDVSNVAQCFRPMPFPGGNGDNLVAPFMFDLNFTTSNPLQFQS